MDPDAALRELLDAAQYGDEQQVSIVVDGLRQWLDNHGYPPKTVGKWKLGIEWHRDVARSLCDLALIHVRRICAERQGDANVPS